MMKTRFYTASAYSLYSALFFSIRSRLTEESAITRRIIKLYSILQYTIMILLRVHDSILYRHTDTLYTYRTVCICYIHTVLCGRLLLTQQLTYILYTHCTYCYSIYLLYLTSQSSLQSDIDHQSRNLILTPFHQ